MLKWWFRFSSSACALAAMSAVAHGEPISIALLGAVGITAAAGSTAAAVTTFALTTAASTALSFVGTLLTSKSTTSPSGVQSEVQYGGDVPRQIPFGVVRVAGQFVYFAGVGDKNKTLHLVYALADWECDGLNHVYIDDVQTDLDSVGTVGTEDDRYEVDGYGSNFIIKFFRGSMTQTADSELVSAAAVRNTGLGPWTSAFDGLGVCYVSIVLTFDEDKFQNGIPNIEFELRGAKLYDWRLDSTNGGSGSHRWNDQTTWEFSENPVVMEYNFRRGFYRGAQKILGMGIPGSDLLHDHYTAAANVCDENVSEGSETVDRYRCSVIINDDAEWRVPIDTFMGACAGASIEKSGLFGVYAGASQTTVMTLTDKDLQIGHPASFTQTLPRSELVNAVYGSYTNAAENWQSDSFTPVINPTWESEDNDERLIRDLQLPQVTSPYQASRIAKIVANAGRKQARHVGVYGPKFSALQAGDWIDWEHSVFGDFVMVIEKKVQVAPLLWQLSMRETGPDVYGGVASAPSLPTIIPVYIPPHQTSFVGAFIPVTLSGANGQLTPAIQVTWTPPTDPSVVAVRVQYRVKGTSAVAEVIHMTPADGILIITDNIMAGTTYEVRARFQLNPDLTSDWTLFTDVETTPRHVVYNSIVAIDTQNYFDRLQAEIEGEGLSAIAEALQTAMEDESIRVDYNAKIISVQATQNESNARATLALEALATQDLAIASLLATVSASVGDVTANGAFKMEVVAAEGGATATIAAFVSADNGLTYNRAGWRLDVVDIGGGVLEGRFVVETDQFFIVENSAGVPSVPFSIIGSDTFIERVIVGDEILSDNYDEDSDGNPIEGFKLGSDGVAKAFEMVAFDIQAKGANFTERPIKTAAPIIQNGVPVGLPESFYSTSANVGGTGTAWSFDTDARFLTAEFHRTPDVCYFNPTGVAKNSAAMGAAQRMYSVPTGQLLPVRMVMEATGGLADYAEFRQDGTLHYIVLDADGDITADHDFDAPWMSELEIDPENRNGLTTIVGSLGVTRGVMPFVVPDGYSYLRISLLGAGGGYDGSNSGPQGGPGGYVTFDLPIGFSEVVKPGDVLWFLIGEGGGPFRTANTQGYGGGGQGSGNRAQGGGGTFCFHKEHSSRLSIIGVAGGGGAGEGGASGGPGGLTTSSNPSGGQSSGGDTMVRCTGRDWDYSSPLKRAAGGGGYEGGTIGGADGNNRGGRGGSSFINTATFNLINTSSASSAAGADGQATTDAHPAAATAKFTGYLNCLGTRFTAGNGEHDAMVSPERAGDGLAMIELIP